MDLNFKQWQEKGQVRAKAKYLHKSNMLKKKEV